ncbi:GATA transcription factor 25 isoform X1 [Ricinus communis]|uniref:GATA transcription factor 25 isoform X1 n=1 Tax=Ricinus communis TaxID=3988 RepID=UPI00201A8E2F|nr:GATA transcription factor 25 isoform X1 [Ricinus communis]
MYSHSQSMNVHHQIHTPTGPTGDDEDGVAADSIDHHHIRYEDGNATGVVLEDDVSHDSVYVPTSAAGSELAIQGNDVSSQLTLTFRGQVYVFDAVTPDKVQAVLLLLGGCELTSGPHGLEVASQNQRSAVVDYPGRCTQPQRAASLNRFRQKRKERNFDKKVRYSVRQEVALRMQRNKGQFTSSKKSDGTYGWGGGQDSGQDDSQQETSCTHCGTSSKSTPMMRRGPSGPRSLCNACGLFWANRGSAMQRLNIFVGGSGVHFHALANALVWKNVHRQVMEMNNVRGNFERSVQENPGSFSESNGAG